MNVLSCLHTAILVADLPVAEQFYGQVLGLAKIERHLHYPGAWYQVGNYQIHLMEHKNYQAALPPDQKWGRNPHIALAVADLSRAIADLQSSGHPVQMSASGRAALFTQDPDGNVIELNQG